MKYLQAFLPFLNGIHESLFEKAKPILDETEQGVFIIYINKDEIDVNANKDNRKIKTIM